MLIVSYPANQLGNCLRAILSMKILADSIGADFAIDFRYGRCSADAAATIRILFPDCILSGQEPVSVPVLDESKCMRFTRLYGTNSDPVVEAIFDPEETLPKQGFGIQHIYSVKPDRMSLSDYILVKHQTYKRLPFPELLKDRIGAFCQRHAMKDVVGMHIRYTDNLLDPLKKSLNTPLPVLERKLQSIVAAGHKVLLCTDNPKVREHLCAAYAPSLIVPDAVSPALQPLYEMMLLAQTSHVIGTYSSTFSYEACLFNGTDLELFENNVWKTYRFSSIKSGFFSAGPSGAPARGAVEARRAEDSASWGKVGRNEACPCRSGKKYKHCHGALA